MAPHFSLLSPSSFISILLLNVETVTDRILIYLACTHHCNHLVSVTAGGPEFPPRAHVAKFYVRLQLIRSALRASKFSVLKFIEIVILRVYSPSILASVCFGTFVTSLANLFSYFVWLRIPDDGSVLEMRIWSILLSLFSYYKSQALTLNTLWGFCKIYAQSTFFVLAGGGGGGCQL